MTALDYEAEARRATTQANRYYRWARSAARKAPSSASLAAFWRRQAEEDTRRGRPGDARESESRAVIWQRIADRETADVDRYRGWARDYAASARAWRRHAAELAV